MSGLAAAARAPELSARSFGRLAGYITAELGIKMPESKLLMLENRLLRRVRVLGLGSVDEYAAYLLRHEDGEERQQFVNLVTTNKTDFYREPGHFVFLESPVLREFTGRRRADRFQVWSAGCSSGEEPYTLAMLLAWHRERNAGFDYAVLGTDISTRVLDQARAGIYGAETAEPLPPVLRAKYLLRGRGEHAGKVRIAAVVRERVSFHQLNLMAPDYRIRNQFDAVFFRNVMIYFDRTTQEAVINRMAPYVAPGGYLFVGHSESLSGLDVPFELEGASVYRKVAAR